MPKIAEIVALPDGRPAVVVELDGDQGSITLWTPEDIERAEARAARDEREACAALCRAAAVGARIAYDKASEETAESLAGMIEERG